MVGSSSGCCCCRALQEYKINKIYCILPHFLPEGCLLTSDDMVVKIGDSGSSAAMAGMNTSLTVAGCTAAMFGRGTGRKEENLYMTTSGVLAAPVSGEERRS